MYIFKQLFIQEGLQKNLNTNPCTTAQQHFCTSVADVQAEFRLTVTSSGCLGTMQNVRVMVITAFMNDNIYIPNTAKMSLNNNNDNNK